MADHHSVGVCPEHGAFRGVRCAECWSEDANAKPEPTSAFFLSLSRDEAQAVINQRAARIKRDMLDLAADLARFNGTTVQHEYEQLRRDVEREVALRRAEVSQ